MPGGLNLADNVVCSARLKNGTKYDIYAADINTGDRIESLQTTAKTVEFDNEAPTLSDIKYYTDDSLSTEVPSTAWYNKPVVAVALCTDTPANESTACACAATVDASTTNADLWSTGIPNRLIGADLMKYTRTITNTLSIVTGNPTTLNATVRIVDKAGNKSQEKAMTVSLDTVAPIVTTTEAGAGATKTIILTATDTASKIWKTTATPSSTGTTTLPAGTTTLNANGIIYRV